MDDRGAAALPLLTAARTALARLIDCSTPLAAVPAVEALALLEDVHPPLPPLRPTAADAPSVDDVVNALAAAAAVVAPRDCARIARAAAALRSPV